MLAEFLERRNELLKLAERNDDAQERAKDNAARRKALLDEGWAICARIWLYRSGGPLANFRPNAIAQMCSYLEYLAREIEQDLTKNPTDEPNKARLDEVHFAQRLLAKYGSKNPQF